MILYIHGRGISPFEWLLKDGLGTQTSRCACSRGARCPSCRPGPLTALSPPKGPTCRHRRSAQADPGLKPRACRTRRRPASFPTTAPHATPGTGPPHREPGPLRSPPCPRPSARRGPPMPPLRELWDSVPGPGRLPQSPARPRALSLLRGDADRGGQAAHGPWGTPLRPAPPAPPAGAPYPSGLTCVGSGLWMLDSALSAAGLVPEDAAFCWHGGDNVYLRD